MTKFEIVSEKEQQKGVEAQLSWQADQRAC